MQVRHEELAASGLIDLARYRDRWTVPPLPPHIRMEHAKGFARALLHGDPESGHVARQSLREKLKELVTR